MFRSIATACSALHLTGGFGTGILADDEKKADKDT